MRLLTTDQKDALDSNRIRAAIFIEALIPDAPLYLSNSRFSHTFDGQEWLGFGSLLDISFAQSDSSLESHKAEITLDGLDVALLSIALNENLERVPVRFYLALWNSETNAPIGKFLIDKGTIGQIQFVPPTSAE